MKAEAVVNAGEQPVIPTEWREGGILRDPTLLADHIVDAGHVALPGSPEYGGRPSPEAREGARAALLSLLKPRSVEDVLGMSGGSANDSIDVQDATEAANARNSNVRALLDYLVEAYGGKIIPREGSGQ